MTRLDCELIINTLNANEDDETYTIKNINPDFSDTSILRNAAQQLIGLTNNTIVTIQIRTTNDITVE